MKRVSYYFVCFHINAYQVIKITYRLRGGDLEVTQSFIFALHES